MKTIIVLGMHRSGTSLVSGILNILGVDIGKELAGKTASNPLGHFENKEFIKLNEEILREAGGRWDEPPKESKIFGMGNKFQAEINELIKSSESEVWGWKDPRTSLTMELYLSYLKNPHLIVCYRNKHDVARSLQKRDGSRTEKVLELCEIYNQRIDQLFLRHPELKRLNLFYEEILENPGKEINRIIEFLGVTPSEEERKKAMNFVLTPRKKVREKTLVLLKFGIKRPWRIPQFIYNKLK